MLIFCALRQAAKWGPTLRVSKVTSLGFVPKARETAKAIANTPQSLSLQIRLGNRAYWKIQIKQQK